MVLTRLCLGHGDIQQLETVCVCYWERLQPAGAGNSPSRGSSSCVEVELLAPAAQAQGGQ